MGFHTQLSSAIPHRTLGRLQRPSPAGTVQVIHTVVGLFLMGLGRLSALHFTSYINFRETEAHKTVKAIAERSTVYSCSEYDRSE